MNALAVVLLARVLLLVESTVVVMATSHADKAEGRLQIMILRDGVQEVLREPIASDRPLQAKPMLATCSSFKNLFPCLLLFVRLVAFIQDFSDHE